MSEDFVIVSVHIPKTGGTSFGQLLSSQFGDKLLLDYDDRVLATPISERQAMNLERAPQTYKDLNRYKAIHGHFMPIKYAQHGFENARFVIWMRDPVERLISRYFHGMRVKKDPVFQSSPSLSEFAQLEKFRNSYCQFLAGFNIDDFDFIGSMASFDQDMSAFCARYNFDEQSVPYINVNPGKKRQSKYEVSDEELDVLREFHAEDIKLYEQAMERRRELLSRPSNTTA